MSEQQWYMAKDGNQIGPMSESELINNVQSGNADGSTLVFTAGMSSWTALSEVPQLTTHLPGDPQGASHHPPPMTTWPADLPPMTSLGGRLASEPPSTGVEM